MSESAQKLPPEVQRSVDAANAAAVKAGLAKPEPKAEEPKAEAAPTEQAAPTDAPADLPKAEVTPISTQRFRPPGDAAEMSQEERTWRGRYDAEVPRLKDAINTLRNQITMLQAAQAQPAQTPATANAPTETPPAGKSKDWYTPEQLEEFGQDFFDLVERRSAMVEERYSGAIEKLTQENEQLRGKLQELGQGVQSVKQQPLYSVLDQKVPHWRTLNTDAGFLEWAQNTQVSDLDDKSMLEALRGSFQRGRIEAVAKIFQTYTEQSQRPQPAQQPGQQAPASPPNTPPGGQPPVASVSQPQPQQPMVNVQPSVAMDSLAGPGAPQESGADPLIQGSTGRLWTDATIAQFYDAVRRQKISPADASRLEADLQHAISDEGRKAGRYRPR